jgi:predicted CXXCH cytochrome family protein
MMRDSDSVDGMSDDGPRIPRFMVNILFLVLLLIVSVAFIAASGEDGEVRSVADGDNSYMDDALYEGSLRCEDCHEEHWDTWLQTPHAGAYGEANEETVVGDWTQDPTIEVAPGTDVTLVLTSNGTGLFVDLNGQGTHVYRVDEVQGAGLWLQVYLTVQGGSRYILPMAWANTLQRWIPFHADEWYDASGTPMMAAKSHVWDLLCVACHTVGAQVEFNSTTSEWVATWEEEGVGCEACHGPGSVHIKPKGEDRLDFIWSTEDAVTCGNCHAGQTPVGQVGGMKTGYPLSAEGRTIRPGDVHDDFFTHTPNLHPDGETVRGQSEEYSDYITSRHSHSLTTLLGAEDRQDDCLVCHSTDYRLAEEGDEPTLDMAKHDIECALCHDMHGTENENNLRLDKWDTCVQCHRNGDIEPPDDPLPSQMEMVMGTIPIEGLAWFPWMEGEVICTDCHMPKMGVREAPYDIPSHTWRFVSPEKSIELGMPNSCTVSCHEAGSEEGLMTDEKALEWVELWKANSAEWILRAEENLTLAGSRLERAEDLGFPQDVVSAQNETFQEALWVLKFVKRDASMVHNPDFYQLLLEFSSEAALGVNRNLTAGMVSGEVIDADGKAVAGVDVRMDDRTWATTGSGGEFLFDIAPGDHTFGVWKDGTKEGTFTVTVDGGQTSDAGKIKFEGAEDGPDLLVYGVIVLVAAVVLIAVFMGLMRGRPEEPT